MIKEVVYKGYAAQPNEYVSEDGELAMAMNLVPEDGGLKGIKEGVVEMDIEEGYRLLYIHEQIFKHYIILHESSNKLYYIDEASTAGKKEILGFDTGVQITEIRAVGKSLIVLTNEGLHYFIWDYSGYKNLGTEIPSLDASPFLYTDITPAQELHLRYGMEYIQQIQVLNGEGLLTDAQMKNLYAGTTSELLLFGDVRQHVYERVFSVINKAESFIKDKGLFLHPFYVRFAYRMYDGGHVKHTPPILLVPNTWGGIPAVYITTNGTRYSAEFNPIFTISTLCAEIVGGEKLKDWKDLITHVDVFVSEPLINYTDAASSLISIAPMPYMGIVDGVWQSTGEKHMPRTMTTINGKITWATVKDAYIADAPESSGDVYVLANVYTWDKGYDQALNKGDLLGYEYGWLVVDCTEKDKGLFNYNGQDLATTELPIGATKVLPESVTRWRTYSIREYSGSIVYCGANDTTVYRIVGPKTVNLANVLGTHYVKMARSDGKAYEEVLNGVSNFYLISEIKIREGTSVIHSGTIPIKGQALSNVAVRQRLTEIGHSLHSPIPGRSMTYNNRFNIVVNGLKIGTSGCNIYSLNPCSEHTTGIQLNLSRGYVEVAVGTQRTLVNLKVEGIILDRIKYFAFNHPNAARLIVATAKGVTNGKAYSVPLRKHELLNLSYAFNNFDKLQFTEMDFSEFEEHLKDENKPILYGNVIWGSSAENPFYFPETNQSMLPVREVLAMSVATKALSEGQFGQFPVYAFADEGVWALTIDESGNFQSHQPVTRGVCINPKGIVQLDQAVLYPTKGGFYLISGSEEVCITDAIITDIPISIKDIQKGTEVMSLLQIKESAFEIKPFKEFLQNGAGVYVHSSQRIILYNEEADYAYVYSLKSKQWGVMESNLQYNVNSYPEALVVTKDNKLVNLSEEGDEKPGLMITQALKLDGGDILKTIDTIIQRGDFDRGDVSTVLWGSRDLKHWHMVWSSKDHYLRGFRGTPYKYFRIGALVNLKGEEMIRGASVQYELRETNKLR